MLSYEPGGGLARSLDPRTKLLAQVGFAIAAFELTQPVGLAALTLVVGGVLVASRIGPVEALAEFGPVVPFLIGAPLVAGVTLGSPWFVPAETVGPTLASYRSVLLLAVGAVYVKTTPVRDSRAAVAWLVPGRFGRGLALAIAFVFRLLPLLQADLQHAREASQARLGEEQRLHQRMRFVALSGLRRAIGRADDLAVALRARCLSWNSTPPPLALSGWDYVVLGGTVGVLMVAFV